MVPGAAAAERDAESLSFLLENPFVDSPGSRQGNQAAEVVEAAETRSVAAAETRAVAAAETRAVEAVETRAVAAAETQSVGIRSAVAGILQCAVGETQLAVVGYHYRSLVVVEN